MKKIKIQGVSDGVAVNPDSIRVRPRQMESGEVVHELHFNTFRGSSFIFVLENEGIKKLETEALLSGQAAGHIAKGVGAAIGWGMQE